MTPRPPSGSVCREKNTFFHFFRKNGQTVLMRIPTQAEFVECWSESIVRNSFPPALVDDPLFRKTLVTTSRMYEVKNEVGVIGTPDFLNYR